MILDRLFYLYWQYAVKRFPRLIGRAEKPFFYSATGNRWDTNFSRGIGGWFPCSNHSFGYHGLLQQFWEKFGFGQKCLLISENTKSAADFSKKYPAVDFISTDYFLDVGKEQLQTHVLWNLYERAPNLGVNSIVCQATIEHVMDPVGVFRKFASILERNGYLYVHTHTPLFPYHPWPKDYLRYHPEWFTDVVGLIPELKVREVVCVYGHAFAVYQKQ
jgi:hypothetical protein